MLNTVHVRRQTILKLLDSAVRSRQDFFSLLSMAQTPVRNTALVRTVSQDLSGVVDAIFGELSMLVPMTEPARRQVWFAAIALLSVDGRIGWFERDDIKRREFIASLLTQSDERILKLVRPEGAPRHYRSCITSFGETARAADSYAIVWMLLKRYPGIGRLIAQRAHSGRLSDGRLAILSMLRPSPEIAREGLLAAERFADLEAFRAWLQLYQKLRQRRGVEDQDIRALAQGVKPEAVMEMLLKPLRFPEPLLGSPFRYVRDWTELERVGEYYRNCLRGRSWLNRATSGAVQIYEWRINETDVVFSLEKEEEGWRLSEAKLISNEVLPRALRMELRSLLAPYGVRTDTSRSVVEPA